MKFNSTASILCFFGLLLINSCQKIDTSEIGYLNPDYDIVFNQTEVQRLDIVIDADYWTVMQEDLNNIFGSGAGGPGMGFSDETPIYVPCQVYHNDKQWYDVGIRYKGNSSLNIAQGGEKKLPFRLEFDHFDNENPIIDNQTFYGFKQLSFSNNYKDPSFLHEKIASDVFREFGVPSAQTAFYRIYIDHGEGSVYFGLYTMVEIIFDTMLDDQFVNSSGNCYKPDGDGARLNNLNQVTNDFFVNKTNSTTSLDDITQLVTAITSTNRTTDPNQWRKDIEEILNIDLYLKWLAANTTMKNWDTYGQMTHNYYLYNDPSTSKLTWIPWDNNETFSDGPGSGPGGGGGGPQPLEFDFSDLTDNPMSNGVVAWPLIRYIYDDPTYKTVYDDYIDLFISTAFEPTKMAIQITDAHELISPYVIGTDGEIPEYTFLNSEAEFTSTLNELIQFVQDRYNEADAYTP